MTGVSKPPGSLGGKVGEGSYMKEWCFSSTAQRADVLIISNSSFSVHKISPRKRRAVLSLGAFGFPKGRQ